MSADLMVKISAHYKDSTLADKQGQIKNISNNVCNVYVEDVDRVISITSDNLEPITPEKSDKVGLPLHPKSMNMCNASVENQSITNRLVQLNDILCFICEIL